MWYSLGFKCSRYLKTQHNSKFGNSITKKLLKVDNQRANWDQRPSAHDRHNYQPGRNQLVLSEKVYTVRTTKYTIWMSVKTKTIIQK